MKLCPRTLRMEFLDDGTITTNGAPCIEDRCMAWQEAFIIPARCEVVGTAIHHIPEEHRNGYCKDLEMRKREEI
jgi:hypothetical protein